MPISRSRASRLDSPGLVGDDDVPAVADQRRVDVLVGARVLLHRRDMQPALMREGALADIGGVAVGRAVEALVEEARDMGQAAPARRRRRRSRSPS